MLNTVGMDHGFFLYGFNSLYFCINLWILTTRYFFSFFYFSQVCTVCMCVQACFCRSRNLAASGRPRLPLGFIIHSSTDWEVGSLTQTQSSQVSWIFPTSLLWRPTLSLLSVSGISGGPPCPPNIYMGFWRSKLPTSGLLGKCFTTEQSPPVQ